MAIPQQLSREFVILGPRLQQDNGVLEAIHALYYLPENYRLVFTGRDPVDEALHKQVADLIERDDLGHRVLFFSDQRAPHAIIADKDAANDDKKTVRGETAEALASAILDVTLARNQ